jgi:phosphoglycerate dehydrogenase-like enzyme
MARASAGRVVVMIATPLEPELAQRVGRVDPRAELLYDPALLPPARFDGDIAGEEEFRRDAVGERRWGEMLARAEVLYGIPGNSGPGLAEVLRGGRHVRWIQARNAGAGEHVSYAVAHASNEIGRVVVTTASGVHGGPLAEFSLLGLLAFAKRLPELEEDKRARYWPEDQRASSELRGRTMLVVGLGAIGRETARLAKAFGMNVLGVKRSAEGAIDNVDEIHTPGRLPALAARADAIVVTLPLTDETRRLVDARTLAAVKRGAIFVNVGRGAVVDEDALVERLRDGTLGGAALDVFEREPLPPDSPLWTLPNVIVSPHSAALVAAEGERVLEVFCDNLRRYLAGEPLRNRVDPQGYY